MVMNCHELTLNNIFILKNECPNNSKCIEFEMTIYTISCIELIQEAS